MDGDMDDRIRAERMELTTYNLVKELGELLEKATYHLRKLVETCYEVRDHHPTEEWLALREAERFLQEIE